ncbi:MAG: ABC transporter substrate-binding protein [Pseudomonadota bacterium]
MRTILGFLIAICLSAGVARADGHVLNIAVLKFGTVNWLMKTIKDNGLDAANGYELEVTGLASGNATRVALQAGEVDMIVADWIWSLNRRASGKDMRFSAYSRTLGKLMSSDSIGSLCDLRGKNVGVVGGPSDKSWIVLQALTTKECGFDLAAETEGVYGAPPLMNKQMQSGDVEAVSTFWHFAARLEASGVKPLQPINEAMAKLGIDPAPPLIGFTWENGKVSDTTLSGFLKSVRAAGALLADDDAAWEALRERMKAKENATFTTLRDAYRAGIITADWTAADTAGAKALYDLLTDKGGEEFKASAGPFDPAVFDAPAIDG